VSVAGNHIADCGPDGITDTIARSTPSIAVIAYLERLGASARLEPLVRERQSASLWMCRP
jgi:hypothetical protein